MLSLKENPPQLPAAYASVADIPGDWYIAHVKSRNEKALAQDLIQLGIAHYLPLQERETYSGGRRRKNLYPFFTSYMFFAGDSESRYTAFTTNRVAHVIPVTDRDTFVGEISNIELALKEGDAPELHTTLPVGHRVEVTQGPFMGTVGLVTGNQPWTAITLIISVLGVGAELKINGDFLELIDEEQGGEGVRL